MSSTDKNKARVREFFDVIINGRNMSRFDEFLSTDFVENEQVEPFPPTREGVRQFFQAMFTAFPDLKVTIEDMIAEDDRVMVRQVWTGTHKGEFMGVPASNNKVKFAVVDIVRLKDNKASEHWGVSDVFTMMQQIGAVPA